MAVFFRIVIRQPILIYPRLTILHELFPRSALFQLVFLKWNQKLLTPPAPWWNSLRITMNIKNIKMQAIVAAEPAYFIILPRLARQPGLILIKLNHPRMLT